MLTLKNILHKSILELANHGILSPDLDARILLLEAIKKESSFVFSHPEYLITNSEYSRFRSYIRRRKKGEPIAYILGRKEFYGHDFIVNKNVLIPRPETEWLVEKSIAFLQNAESRITNHANCHPELVSGSRKKKMLKQVQHDKINVLDVGTGSGCIIISIVNALHNSKFIIHNSFAFYATDLSQKALRTARKNAKLNNIQNIHFYFSDLFSNRFLHKKFDLIIANLPYVPRSGKNKSIAFEPKDAIFANDYGTAIIKKFLTQVKSHINDGAMILLEADCRNAKKISEFAKNHFPEAKVELKKDLAGLDRFIVIEK